MNVRINLQEGTPLIIKDLTSIKLHAGLNYKEKIFSVDQIDSFYLSKSRSYSFIGTPTIAIVGEDIHSVEFYG